MYPKYAKYATFFFISLMLAAGTGVVSAAAQPIDTSETGADARTEPTPSTAAERKSPGRAVFYSVAGTAVLAPVAGVGVVFGPALGHFYAGNEGQACTGIRLRLVSLGVAGLGGVLALGTPLGWALLTAGAFVTAGSALYDTVTAWHAAKDDNESQVVSAQVTPTVDSGGKQAGLTLRMSF